MARLSGRPLLDTHADRPLFAGRDRELQRLEDAYRQGLNTLLVGEHGSGRTSLLRQLELRLRTDGGTPVYLDAGGFPEPAELVVVLRERLTGPQVEQVFHLFPPSLFREKTVWSSGGKILNEIDLLRTRLTESDVNTPGVVLLDQPDAKAAHTLFGRLRDEIWGLPLVWVVAVDPGRRATVLQPPADAFFESIVELAPLSDDAAAHLIQRRMPEAPLPPELLDWVVRGGQGVPRRLLTLAREAQCGDAELIAERDAQRVALDARLHELPPSARAVLDALRAIGGPVSASDGHLLTRLGWSRSRTTQVLRQLEGEALVTRSAAADTGTPGRPRVLYELAQAAR